ncbi:hypothetical protein OXX80_012124 [Metschnikowia pulcherrima]
MLFSKECADQREQTGVPRQTPESELDTRDGANPTFMADILSSGLDAPMLDTIGYLRGVAPETQQLAIGDGPLFKDALEKQGSPVPEGFEDIIHTSQISTLLGSQEQDDGHDHKTK